MGAFVGIKISPFFRRRKGRVGTDILVEKTAPTLTGGVIDVVAANYQGMICARNAGTTYQHNKDGGDSAWVSVALPAARFLGSSTNPGNVASTRPFSEINFFETITIAGRANAGDGMIFKLSDNLNFISDSVLIAAAPQCSVGWEDSGDICLCMGRPIAGLAKGRGGQFEPLAEVVSITAFGGGNGIESVKRFYDPGDTRETWIAQDVGAPQNLEIIVRTKPAGTWSAERITANGLLGGTVRHFLQKGPMIFGLATTNNGVRSLDYGKTWSVITGVTGAGTGTGIHRYGNRLYVIANSAPKLRISRNNGTTWQNDSIVLPSATAVPDSYLVDSYGRRFIFCHDGAVNRLYQHSTYGEI